MDLLLVGTSGMRSWHTLRSIAKDNAVPVLVAHNGTRFDNKMLAAECERTGEHVPGKCSHHGAYASGQ